MDIRTYNIKLEVLLKPVINIRCPTAHLRFNDQIRSIALTSDTWYEFSLSDQAQTPIHFEIEHYGKTDKETNMATGADVAIIVDQIKINNVSSSKFVWAGIYRPIYPLHLVNQPAELNYSNYMGWNGTWSLDLHLPAFAWIHDLENLGWIYD
jgi:hypothetical protein